MRIDPAADRRTWRPAPGYLAVAVAVAVAGLMAAWMSSSSPADAPAAPIVPGRSPMVASSATSAVWAGAAATPSARVAGAGPASPPPASPQEISRARDPDGDLTPDIADFVNSGERPTMAEVIARLQQAGVQGGLAAFAPPGTRPPLVGLAVPEDFPLPEGYVRHHQATDDGQRIEPILMYAPSVPLVDAAGRPLLRPADRVVPPELAPPGLPLRRIVVPAPTEPGRPGS